MTYRQFSSHSKLGPPTETTGEGYAAFKKKLEELKRIAPLPDPQAEIIAQETREDALGRDISHEKGLPGEEYDPDVKAGIWGVNDSCGGEH